MTLLLRLRLHLLGVLDYHDLFGTFRLTHVQILLVALSVIR